MAIIQNLYTGNGSTVLFSFSFPYLEEDHIFVSLNGTLTTAFTFPNANTVQFNTAPAVGVAIRIFRETPLDQPEAVIFAGSAIRASDLNKNNNQLLYVAQESNFEAESATTTANTALVNSTTAISTANGAVSTANTASANASAAVSTANTASSNASAAVSTANTASSNASAAVITANTAAANASTALSTANSTASQFAVLDANVYDSSELNNGQLDNRYYTETELNAGQLDNRYYTETELNAGQLDNRYFTETEADARYYNVNTESIKSTDVWTNSDGFVATTAAIEARVITLVDEVGGFVPIATHTAFPTTNPDINNNAGTVVSIASVSGLTHSAGTSTNATTTGSTPVTITGIPGSLPSPATATGMLVVTTGTLNTYTFHRLTPEVNDVVNVANNATNITTVAGQISPTNNVGTVAGIAGNVTTVAGISGNVTTVAGNTANVNNVAGISGNVTTVAGISSNVTIVAGNTTNINAVAGNSTNINTVATNNSNVTAVGVNIANVIAVDGNSANINSVVANAADISTTAGSIANVNTTAGNIADVNTTATNIASVNSAAGSIANINTTAGNIANINNVANNIADVNTVGTNVANIITAAGYLNSFNALYLGVLTADPSVDSLGNPVNIGDFYWNSVMEQTRIFNGVSWVSIGENSLLLTSTPNANFSVLYTASPGTNTITLGDLSSSGVFEDENAPTVRVALASGSGTYSFGNL
jgi:hypothetical protein